MAWEESWPSVQAASGLIGREKYEFEVKIWLHFPILGSISYFDLFEFVPFVPGNELRWRFTSDGSVNGWGWRFTVYPVVSAGTYRHYRVPFRALSKIIQLTRKLRYPNIAVVAANGDMQSERLLLVRPSISAVACLLDSVTEFLSRQESATKQRFASRLAVVLAGCAQRSSLSTITVSRFLNLASLLLLLFMQPACNDRIWALQRLRRLLSILGTFNAPVVLSHHEPSAISRQAVSALGSQLPGNLNLCTLAINNVATNGTDLLVIDLNNSNLGKLLKNLPDLLLLQYEFEEAAVRGGQQLLHSPFFQVFVALACDLHFDR